jgi:hypothetical protein
MSNEDHIVSQTREHDMSLGEAGSGWIRARILARRLARSLTVEEIESVSGALSIGHTHQAGTSCTPDIGD